MGFAASQGSADRKAQPGVALNGLVEGGASLRFVLCGMLRLVLVTTIGLWA